MTFQHNDGSAGYSRALDLLAILDAGPLPYACMTRAQRQAMQTGVDALIDYLDAIEGDPDIEDDGCAEPYMSQCETGAGRQLEFQAVGGDECEDGHDHEPSLGAPEHDMGLQYAFYGVDRSCDQTTWARSSTSDLELVNEDGGDILDEPHGIEEDCHA